MVPGNILYLIVTLIASSLASNDESANVYLSPNNYTESRLEVPPRIDVNDSAIADENNPRDKRALGVILQGLVEALGYTVSPITYASLPNPNTTSPPAPPPKPMAPSGPAPVPKPIAPSGSAPAAMTTAAPRQRETLRFTGVVNFGNNSDLLGHLQQYERIFHGNATSTAAPAPARPPPPPGPASGKPALLTPYFVPIPLPLAPNLPPLPPSAPRRAKQMELTYAKQEVNENYERESQEISDEKDVRRDPPGRDSDRDTYIDEPRWKKKQREKDEDERKNHREEPDSSEENDEIEEKNKYREQEIVGREEDAEDSKKDQQVDEKESAEEDREEGDKRSNIEDDESEDSREQEYTKKSEDNDDRENSSERESDEDRAGKNKDDDEDTTSRSDFDGLEKPFGYSPKKCPPALKQFGNRLPIRVFDEPFSIRGELRNSYGESLEQDGKIDESVADYFQKYKHPETGLFDSRKVQSLQGPKEKDLWWRSDRPSALGIAEDPLERIRKEYAAPANKGFEEDDSESEDDEAVEQKGGKDEPKERTYDEEVESTEVKDRPAKGQEGTTSRNNIQYPRVPANKRYEEYNSERKDDESVESKGRKDEPKERTYDEEVESTEVKSRPAKGREGTTIQYPRVPANRRYEEYNSERKDGVQRGRKTDSEADEYDERVDSTELKYRPVTGRGRGRTFKDTIQQPRVPANGRYEEYNPKRNDGEEQRSREEDPEEIKYDGRVESTEVKSRPVTGRGRGKTFKDTIQQARVPVDSRYEEYNSKNNDGEEHRSREEDPEERKYDERVESSEVKSRPVTGRGRGRTFKDTIQQPRVPVDSRYEYGSKVGDGEVGGQRSREEDPEERKYHESVASTEVNSRPVKVRGRGRTFKDTIHQAKVPADSRYEDYGSKSDNSEVGEQRSREEDPEERKYDERVESTEVKSRPVKGREGTTTSRNTIQHARIPENTWYEQYNSAGKDGEVGEQGSRKKDPEEEYGEGVESKEAKYGPVKGREGRTFKDAIQQPRVPVDSRYEYGSKVDDGEVGGQRSREEDPEERKYDERVESTEVKSRPVTGTGRGRTFKNTIQQLRVPADSRYEEYDSKSDGEVGEQRSKERSEEREYDERVESTEPKDRTVLGRDRTRTSKNSIQHPREPATTRYEEYNLPREDNAVGLQRGRKDPEEKDYDESAQTTDAKYRPVKGQGRARAFKNYQEDESAGPSVEERRPEVREKQATSRDEDAMDEIAEPTVTTYTRINSLEEIGQPHYEDGSEEAGEASQYEPSSGRINLPDYDSAEESTSLSKFQLLDPKNPLLFKGFDFIKYSPYFRPIQVSYEPGKLQRTAARILANFGEDASEDKSRSSEQLRDQNVASPQRPAAVESDEYITHNPYLKPIQVAYQPEKLQRTADRILSYHNAIGQEKSREEAKQERIRSEEQQKEEGEKEKDQEEETEGEEGRKEYENSERNSKERDEPSQSYEEQDGRSADDASEDDGPAQNYEDRENSSVENSNEDDAPSRNYQEREDRSSVNSEIENDVKPGVGLPERLTGKKLHEGESKELRAWPAPFDHTFDSTERAKVVRHPNSEVSTKIRDEDVEPTYETPAVLEFQSTRPTEYPPDSVVAPTYETRWSVELRASGPTAHYPLDSDVSPTDESPSVENSPNPEPRSNIKVQRRPQADARRSSAANDDLEKERKQSRVTKVEAKIRGMVQPSPHREAPENSNSRDGNPSIRLQIFEPNESKDFSEEGYRPQPQRDIAIGENLRPPAQTRKFNDPESAHDFFGFGRDDYVLTKDAKNAPNYGENVQKTTTPSESSEKELLGLLVISHDPNHQHVTPEVTLTKFTEEPETETERVKVNEYRNKVATLKVSEQRQSTPHGPVRHVGYTRSL